MDRSLTSSPSPAGRSCHSRASPKTLASPSVSYSVAHRGKGGGGESADRGGCSALDVRVAAGFGQAAGPWVIGQARTAFRDFCWWLFFLASRASSDSSYSMSYSLFGGGGSSHCSSSTAIDRQALRGAQARVQGASGAPPQQRRVREGGKEGIVCLRLLFRPAPRPHQLLGGAGVRAAADHRHQPDQP